MPYGRYPCKTTPTQGLQLERGTLTTLEMLSTYTAEEGGAAIGGSRVSRA